MAVSRTFTACLHSPSVLNVIQSVRNGVRVCARETLSPPTHKTDLSIYPTCLTNHKALGLSASLVQMCLKSPVTCRLSGKPHARMVHARTHACTHNKTQRSNRQMRLRPSPSNHCSFAAQIHALNSNVNRLTCRNDDGCASCSNIMFDPIPILTTKIICRLDIKERARLAHQQRKG